MHAKMNRLPAHLTREDDWSQDQPGVRLSRVFGVVLGIHIVAIGGLVAYEMFRHHEPAVPAGASALRPAAREARPAAAGAAAAQRVTDAFADDPVHEGLIKHVVAPGERLADIAARYGVDERALTAKNRIGDARPFASGMKLVIPNRQLQAAAPVVTPAPLSGSAGSSRAGASPVAGSGDALRTPPEYDPSIPTLRAEPVDEPAPARAPARAAAPKPAVTKPAARPPASERKPSAVAAGPKKPVAPVRKVETAAKPKAKGRVHVVREGDTAYQIARKYGVNLDQLIRTNGINPNTLRPGTSLTIPPPTR